jgi:hypothetical protein
VKRRWTILSFVLMLLAIAGWIRSRYAADEFRRTSTGRHERSFGVSHYNGVLFLHYFHREYTWMSGSNAYGALDEAGIMGLLRFRTLLGTRKAGWQFEQWHSDSLGTRTVLMVIGLPYWVLVALFGLAPAWWVLRLKHRLQARRRARRQAAGCCELCGYDLRASPQRCPECGVVPEAPA